MLTSEEKLILENNQLREELTDLAETYAAVATERDRLKNSSGRAVWLANADGMEPAHWHTPWSPFITPGWRNCYTGEPITWEPTHWRKLPEPLSDRP